MTEDNIIKRLERYSSVEVEKMLRHITKNGELRDYDDEIANRIEDAADLCLAVRQILPWVKGQLDEAIRDVITQELIKEGGHGTWIPGRGPGE